MKFTTKAVPHEYHIIRILNDGEKLYAVDKNQMLYNAALDGKSFVLGSEIIKVDVENIESSEMLIYGDKLYYYYEYTPRKGLVELDFHTKKKRKLINDMNGSNISRYKAGKLLVSKTELKNDLAVGKISILDTESGKMNEFISFEKAWGIPSRAFYMKELDKICYIDGAGDVYAVGLASRLQVSEAHGIQGMPSLLSGGRIAFHDYESSSIRVKRALSNGVKADELVIAAELRGKSIAKAEIGMNGVKLKLIEKPYESKELAQYIINSGNTWDIMQISGDEIDVESLVKKGYAEPLQSEKISAYMDKIWDALKEYSYHEGKLYLFPADFSIDDLYFRPSFLKDLA